MEETHILLGKTDIQDDNRVNLMEKNKSKSKKEQCENKRKCDGSTIPSDTTIKNKFDKYCFHCRKRGHLIQDCKHHK